MEGQRLLLERIFDGAEDPTDLPLALLMDITNNFSEERKIGQGGFGAVYKGVLGGRIVAVKRIYINEDTVDDKLFHREFYSLCNTNHRNVIRFLGFCSNTHQKTIKDPLSGKTVLANIFERCLCFEYIDNGSLDMHITDELRGLGWEIRYEIIIGICKGIVYLHNEKNIIHMDLKPANILLHHEDDKYIVPKITDFGLSRLSDNLDNVGRRYGTRGYMAPEYEKYGETTFMSDIYSLGAIIIELVTGCKHVPNKDNVLRRWRHRWNKPPTQLQYQQVTRCIHIAGRCRGENPEFRPSIKEIISFLSESESTYGQISPNLDEDDMLGIKPLELRLPSEFNGSIESSIELTNGTSKCIAFNIELPISGTYSAHPVKGIIRPGSKYDVKITVQTQEVHRSDHVDKFIVQSMKGSDGLTEEEITKLMSGAEAHKVVDEVDLMVLYECKKYQEKPKRREYTNMPAEEVPEARKRKIVESAGNGKNKLGSSKNTEETSKFGQGESSSSTRTKNYLLATEPMAMTFQELHRMTNGFSEERLLGTGGYGKVYKGVFDNGEVIAVKKLTCNPELVEAIFKNELLNLMRIQHQNIVRLVGYCSEIRKKVVEHEGKHPTSEQERALCLEYMECGSLDEHLSDESCGLDWGARYKIIKGICQGLKHLHKGSNEPIFHLDLKPANILLDKDWTPKIGDFGLSRLLDSAQTFVTKSFLGSRGYMPPEYIDRDQISPKFDVYSLGVIIIQVVAGREGYHNCGDMTSQDFITLVTENWLRRDQEKQMVSDELLQVQKCIEIALRCIEAKRVNRPTITEIVDELNMIS